MKNSISHSAAIVAATALAGIAGEPFDLSWYTINGGGAMRSTGGAFVLSGTIGQPDAGNMSGGNFKLTGGFWFETRPGDCNANGIVGLLDHATFIDCLTGPDVEVLFSDKCRCFDFDGSGTPDLADFSSIQNGFLGE